MPGTAAGRGGAAGDSSPGRGRGWRPAGPPAGAGLARRQPEAVPGERSDREIVLADEPGQDLGQARVVGPGPDARGGGRRHCGSCLARPTPPRPVRRAAGRDGQDAAGADGVYICGRPASPPMFAGSSSTASRGGPSRPPLAFAARTAACSAWSVGAATSGARCRHHLSTIDTAWRRVWVPTRASVEPWWWATVGAGRDHGDVPGGQRHGRWG